MPKTSDETLGRRLNQIDPRWRVLFLVLVAVGVFLLRRPVPVALLTGGLLIAAFAVGLPLRRILRTLLKLWGFAAVVLLSYAFVPEDSAADVWVHWGPVPLNIGGLQVGGLMLLRLVSVVLASQIARSGDARAIAEGLRRWAMPAAVAEPLDAVLALLEADPSDQGPAQTPQPGRGRGGGRGEGSGGGRRRQASHPTEAHEPFWAALKRLARGDLGPLASRLDRQIERAQIHLGGKRDAAVISGIALTMLGIRAVKILPSLPFAPGHKLVLLTPLYIVAALTTRSRFGATLTGLVMGTVAFLLGDGKYGIFELLKHVAPGILCDLFAPALQRRRIGGWGWSLFGAFVAVGRFATILSVVAVVQAPKVAYALLTPGLIVHCLFGAGSGYVTHHLLKHVRNPWESSSPETDEHTSNHPSCESPSSTGG